MVTAVQMLPMAGGILSISSRLVRTLKLNPRQRFSAVSRFSSQSLSGEQFPLSNVLRRYGFPPRGITDFLSKYRKFMLGLCVHEVEQSLRILSSSLKIPQESLIPMLFECPAVLELDFIKKWQGIFCDLALPDVSPVGIANMIMISKRLEVKPDGFLRNFQALKCLGVGEATVCRILEECPRAILTVKDREIYGKVDFLEGIGVQRNRIDWILYSFPGILGLDLEGRLKQLLIEFKQLGLGEDLIRKEITREPRILSMELGELSRCMNFLWSLRCREAIRWKIFDKGALQAGFQVKIRVDCLCRYGLIHRDAFTVLWKEPRVILYEMEEIERKIEFLINRMKYDIESLVDVPEYLGVNFEKQIVPRYSVIEYLRSIDGLGDPIHLRELVKFSRLRFYNFYVKPYPECEKLYGRFSVRKDKRGHPVGLWKLFKPQKFPMSEEELRDMRSFMESLGG
ncbi:hypothetical protein SAY87_004247 [Trapa incisa]|uniref:Transcription termination factor MTERF15, mitochondrial n=1 Tax=Trapa incisa TaxID=236973 RepID=A0AAN7JNJ3_9MYRT|nr:hypothetical protein SAY87_004247 [Trapa incisa]